MIPSRDQGGENQQEHDDDESSQVTVEPVKSESQQDENDDASSLPMAEASQAIMSLSNNVAIRRPAQLGDIVTIDLQMVPEHGYVPESLFDTSGIVTFVLGWGNYLPGLHQLVQGLSAGETLEQVSVDAGYGARRDDLLLEVPRTKLRQLLQKQQKQQEDDESLSWHVGMSLTLPGNIAVSIHQMGDETVILDANPPLAGTSYACSLQVIQVESPPSTDLINDDTTTRIPQSPYHVASFALGCFWGAELAFLRLPGVVGTQVGYSQGTTVSPTYEQVSSGTTQHREVTMVIYDSRIVSYEQLLCIALERLEQTTSSLELHQLFQQQDDDEDSYQYKHGFYFHSARQEKSARECLKESKNSRFGIELLPCATFFKAEEYHQQYLFKGGQSAKKGSKETIRCFG